MLLTDEVSLQAWFEQDGVTMSTLRRAFAAAEATGRRVREIHLTRHHFSRLSSWLYQGMWPDPRFSEDEERQYQWSGWWPRRTGPCGPAPRFNRCWVSSYASTTVSKFIFQDEPRDFQDWIDQYGPNLETVRKALHYASMSDSGPGRNHIAAPPLLLLGTQDCDLTLLSTWEYIRLIGRRWQELGLRFASLRYGRSSLSGWCNPPAVWPVDYTAAEHQLSQLFNSYFNVREE